MNDYLNNVAEKLIKEFNQNSDTESKQKILKRPSLSLENLSKTNTNSNGKKEQKFEFDYKYKNEPRIIYGEIGNFNGTFASEDEEKERYKREAEEKLNKPINKINENIIDSNKEDKEQKIIEKTNEINEFNKDINKVVIDDGDTFNVVEDNDEEDQIKGNILKEMNEVDFLTDRIKKDYEGKVIYNLIYKATIDGDKAADFHAKCDSTKDNLILVESCDGRRFGGFSSCSWDGEEVEKRDESAFIFSLDKLKIYELSPTPSIFCAPNIGPVFNGNQLKLFDNFFQTGGIAIKELYENIVFSVKEVEVYQLEEGGEENE